MTQVHHATARKFAALVAEFDIAATLEINPATGNPELAYDDRKFEAESAKDLVEALRAELEDDEDYTGDHLEDLEIEAEETGDEDDEERPSPMVPPKYKVKYAAFHDTCGDDLAKVLQDACFAGDSWNEDNFLTICAQNGVNPTWRGNNGQRKMCLSNILRARARKGQTVEVLDVVVGGATQTAE
jgi:hypothetical protein